MIVSQLKRFHDAQWMLSLSRPVTEGCSAIVPASSRCTTESGILRHVRDRFVEALSKRRASWLRRIVTCAWVAHSLVACSSPEEPPGRTAALASDPSALLAQPRSVSSALMAQPRSNPLPIPPEVTEQDLEILPSVKDLEPGHGSKLASIAMRSYVYISPNYQSPRIGYLRAGAIVDRAAEPAGFNRCKGGFYRIAPRGYVCVGIGASLDVEHPVAQAAYRGPRRGQPFPYDYVISRIPPPHLYVHLPTPEEQHDVEGRPVNSPSMNPWVLQELAETVGEPSVLSFFLASRKDLPKPAGAQERVRFPAHRGRAKPRSAFGLIATFDWTNRRFGLTTELDLVPLNRTRLVHLSSMHGVELMGEGLVPAFVTHHDLHALRPDADGKLREAELVPFRSGYSLTGVASSGGVHRIQGKPGEALAAFLETAEGVWLPASSLRIGHLGTDMWGHATRGKRWIDVSIERQMLIAYEGTRPIFATLVSTGRGGLSNPHTTSATIQGTFFVQSKHVSATMDGDPEDETARELHDVPYVQYFHQNYAIHGAYWHDQFGKTKSHGCVNVSPSDAAWLFEFTEPAVPQEWHGAMTPARGTLIYIHP